MFNCVFPILGDQESLPVRYKKTIYINVAPMIEPLLTIVKKLIKDKMVKRVRHNNMISFVVSVQLCHLVEISGHMDHYLLCLIILSFGIKYYIYLYYLYICMLYKLYTLIPPDSTSKYVLKVMLQLVEQSQFCWFSSVQLELRNCFYKETDMAIFIGHIVMRIRPL